MFFNESFTFSMPFHLRFLSAFSFQWPLAFHLSYIYLNSYSKSLPSLAKYWSFIYCYFFLSYILFSNNWKYCQFAIRLSRLGSKSVMQQVFISTLLEKTTFFISTSTLEEKYKVFHLYTVRKIEIFDNKNKAKNFICTLLAK